MQKGFWNFLDLRVTAVCCGGIKNWCSMQGNAARLQGTGERFLMKYWRRLEMGPEHVCPSFSAPPPGNNVRALEGNSQSCQLRWVGSCERACVCVSKLVYTYNWLSIYLRAGLSVCVCVCVCVWMWGSAWPRVSCFTWIALLWNSSSGWQPLSRKAVFIPAQKRNSGRNTDR